MAVEITRDHRRFVGPVMHRKREVVAADRNLISLARLLHQRSVAPAHGTLQILEDHDGNLRSFGWTQRRVDRILGGGNRNCESESKCENCENFVHSYCETSVFWLDARTVLENIAAPAPSKVMSEIIPNEAAQYTHHTPNM